jgi:hypothetical protein
VEGDLHAQLKRCAAAWLRCAGAAAVAHEVTTPIPHWRADVAAWLRGDGDRLDALPSLPRARIETPAVGAPPCGDGDATLWKAPPETPLASLLRDSGAVDLFGQPDPDPPAALRRAAMRLVRTVIVECKASRADFLSDRAELDRASREHARLRARRDRIREQLLSRWEPHLRRSGETLFAETDGWNFEGSRLASVRQADRDERLAAEALRTQVKFSRMAAWRLADRLYLCTPSGLLKASEVPKGWGLLEVTRGAVRVRVSAPDLDCPAPRRWRAVTCVQRQLDREVD